MAQTDEKVYAAVEEALRKNPDATNAELLDAAKSASSSVANLGAREFNARYPLQIKRRLGISGGKARKSRGAKKAGGARKAAGGAKKGARGAKNMASDANAAAVTRKAAGGRKAGATRKASGAKKAAAAGGATPAMGGTKRRGRPVGTGRGAGRRGGRRRAEAQPSAAAAPQAQGGGANRDRIRQEFMSFATEIVNAGDQTRSLMKVLSSVDRYVERVIAATG